MYNDFDMGPKDVERIDPNNIKIEEFETDVEGVKADAFYSKGMEKFPAFIVSDDEFNKCTDTYRNKVQLTGPANDYIKGARTNRPIYILNKEHHIKKIK